MVIKGTLGASEAGDLAAAASALVRRRKIS